MNQTAGNRLIVSSTTRPVGYDLVVGREIYELDTGRTLVYDGTGWIITDEPAQNYTIAFTNLTNAGAGFSNAGVYRRSGGYCTFRCAVLLGAAPTVGSLPTLTLPTGIASFDAAQCETFTAKYLDASAATRYKGSILANGASTTTFALAYEGVSGANIIDVAVAVGAPFTWAVSDTIWVAGIYQMATRYS